MTLAGVTRRRAGLILTAIAPAVFAAGCLPMLPMLALDLAPMGLHTIEAATVSAGNSITGGEPGDDEEEDNAKCDQLAGAIPYVTEVKQDADGAIEIRQWGISSESGKTKWTVVVDKNTSPDGWRYEAGFAEMNFSPPLGTELAAEHARYFIFAAAQASDATENERLISFISTFGPADGTFQWRGRVYNYAVAKKLPCFAIAS